MRGMRLRSRMSSRLPVGRADESASTTTPSPPPRTARRRRRYQPASARGLDRRPGAHLPKRTPALPHSRTSVKAFAELYAALDETTKTGEKVDALARYFASVPPADAAWGVHFLSGRR